MFEATRCAVVVTVYSVLGLPHGKLNRSHDVFVQVIKGCGEDIDQRETSVVKHTLNATWDPCEEFVFTGGREMERDFITLKVWSLVG